MVKASFEIAPADDEEYWDGDFHDESDDEEAFDGTPAPMNGLSNGHAVATDRKKAQNNMKRMKVATQRDYASSNALIINTLFHNPKCRGMCCMGSMALVLVLLFVKWIIPTSSTAGAILSAEEPVPQCKVPTTNVPFSEWMHIIRRANETELCRPEVTPQNCNCHNPFSDGYNGDEEWHAVFDSNLHALNETIGKGRPLDLVLYGDSIIERMNGRVFGKPVEYYQDQLAVTKELFTKEGGGKIEALPLGIAGEEIHSLIYRLKNGEMPNQLTPGAWWLMIGTNDVIKNDCDVDAVVAGIITVAEEILRRDEINRQFDASHVVINSLFPRLKLEADPLWTTIRDINTRLECYANTTKGVEFFNATELFVDVDAVSGTARVNVNLFLTDGIHLSAHGTRIWEQAIVEKTLYLIEHNS